MLCKFKVGTAVNKESTSLLKSWGLEGPTPWRCGNLKVDMVKGSVRRLRDPQERWGRVELFRLQNILEVKEMQKTAFEHLTTSEGILMLRGD